MTCGKSLLLQKSSGADPQEHIVLILDKHLQKLPWESLPFLRVHSVSRMPSFQSLIGLSIDKEFIPNSILNNGVDPQKVFYFIDPHGSITKAVVKFRHYFRSKTDWEEDCGDAPDPGRLIQALTSKDLYINDQTNPPPPLGG